jgi:uncharacterized protein
VTRVVVTGATGLIGAALVRALVARGDEVVVLTRDRERAAQALGAGIELQEWHDPLQAPPDPAILSGAGAVVNLLGEPISQRWTAEIKQRIRQSRELGTRNLIDALRSLTAEERPAVLVSGSATGFYGPRGDEVIDEAGAVGSDWLARLVQAWEGEALAASGDGIRVVVSRTGVVLAERGGALAKMLPPFKLGVGGPIAGGRQYIPWIHLDDAVGAILHCLDDDRANGPVNVVAPSPQTNRDFSRALGRALHRPAVMPVPGLALKLMYGEMSEIVLTGQRAVPSRLGALGYEFRHSEVEAALRDVLRG